MTRIRVAAAAVCALSIAALFQAPREFAASLDLHAAQWLHAQMTPFATTVLTTLTTLGSKRFVLPALTLIALVLAARGDWRRTGFTIMAGLGALLVSLDA